MEIPKVYKALVKTKGGRLVSIWADPLLDYHEGEVTYAPEGSMGIFIKTSLEGAKYNGMSNSRRRCEELEGTLVVHEATPLGNLCSKAGSSTFLVDDRYPAILLGKEVWRDEPKPKFKVGDRVIITNPAGAYCGAKVGMIGVVDDAHSLHSIVLTIPDRVDSTKGGYQVDGNYIELAPPKEEWVDVTKECEARIMGSHRVVLYHQHIEIMELSLSKPYITTTALGSAYKVEPTETVLDFGKHGERQDFKILKKVVK